MARKSYKEQGTGTVFGDHVYERTVPDGHFLTATTLNLKRMVKALTEVNFRGRWRQQPWPGVQSAAKAPRGQEQPKGLLSGFTRDRTHARKKAPHEEVPFPWTVSGATCCVAQYATRITHPYSTSPTHDATRPEQLGCGC